MNKPPNDHIPTLHLTQHSLLGQWAVQVMLPLAIATIAGIGLLALAAWQLWNADPSGALTAAMWHAGALMLATLLLILGISWGIAMSVMHPLAELTDAVERMGRGESVRLTPRNLRSAIGRLQHGVNTASDTLSRSHGRLLEELRDTATELAAKNRKLEAANQAQSRLFAAASHDLRQPLYALTLFSSTLREGEDDPDRLSKIQHIEECVTSLDQLFAALLDLSRLEAGTMQPVPAAFPLDSVFDDVSRNFRMLAESRGLRLVVRKTDLWVNNDRTMLTRILNNLVSNALRYTKAGGVLVGARQRASGNIRIDVWDTGSGIAPEHQQRVFDEFFQVRPPSAPSDTRKRGLGLGLATVRKLAELTGCDITLASRLNRGTTVSIGLPACLAGLELQPELREPNFDLNGIRVLVIDDEPVILEGLRMLFREWNCDVRTALDGEGALSQLRSWPTPPDIVISDLHLGAAQNGLDVLRLIALHYHAHPDTPGFARIIITGETRPDRIRQAALSGVPVLFKPVAPQRLREAMLAAMVSSRAASRLAKDQRLPEPAVPGAASSADGSGHATTLNPS